MGTKAIGTVQAIESGIFCANFSGNKVAIQERIKATIKEDPLKEQYLVFQI